MNDAHNQRLSLLAALRNGAIDTHTARKVLDVMHPAARIQELRERGHAIVTNWLEVETRPGKRHRMAIYTLRSESGVTA